ncbi:MAG: DUF1328 domain-containing protein [Pirellulaceae bacterium]
MLQLVIVSIVIALLATLAGFGTFAGYSWVAAAILFFTFLVLSALSILTRGLQATIASHQLHPIHWRARPAPRSRIPVSASLRRDKPQASNVRSRSEPAVASGTNMSSPSTDASLCAAPAMRATSDTWRPPLCWRHLNPRNPIH